MATVADKANETHNVQKRDGGREVLVKVYPIKLRRRKIGRGENGKKPTIRDVLQKVIMKRCLRFRQIIKHCLRVRLPSIAWQLPTV